MNTKRLLVLVVPLASVIACSSTPRVVLPSTTDAGASEVIRPDEKPADIDPDAFWENDPPPQWCGKGKAPAEATPGGTPECPSDKNKEGCPCPELGAEAPCWPGLRKHRGLGICKDGVTRCEAMGEIDRAWGACRGAVKPKKNASQTSGKEACTCFSKGTWAIENIVPCILEFSPGTFAALSTVGGECPTGLVAGQLPKKPTTGSWSKDSLTADCAGSFELCLSLKAGDVDNPKATDCVVTRVCTKGDYTTPNKAQSFPPLPHWVSHDTACVANFESVGGYSEMTVIGESVRCDEVSDDGKPLVFRRGGFCPSICGTDKTRPECVACVGDASGEF